MWWVTQQAELENKVLDNWEQVRSFMNRLQREGTCPSSTAALVTALDGAGQVSGEFALQLQFAALKHVSSVLIKTTYALEDERLELLVARRWVYFVLLLKVFCHDAIRSYFLIFWIF